MGRWIVFLLGVILFLGSLPQAGIMLIELVHDQRMDMQYTIKKIDEGYPATPSIYKFHGHRISIEETLSEIEGYTDAWDNEMAFFDLAFVIDGQEVDRLPAHPVRKNEEGLNRYYGEVAYFNVDDRNKSMNEFVVALKKRKETIQEKSNGDIVGWVPGAELMYTYYAVNEAGEVTRKDFNYETRNGFETKLLTKGMLASTSVGYYTDAWHGYPSMFFPFLYPFSTLIIGGVLTIVFRPFWRKRRI